MFQIFLNTLAKKYSREFVLLFVDGAGNHRSDKLVIPANIMMHPLPAYSPELNPQEKYLGRNSGEHFQKLCPQIHGRGLRQAGGGCILHRMQSKTRQIHHVVPLHRQVIVIWKRYQIKVSARRMLHLRFNDLNNPEPVPRDTDYASLIESTEPIVVQHTRLELAQSLDRFAVHDRIRRRLTNTVGSKNGGLRMSCLI